MSMESVSRDQCISDDDVSCSISLNLSRNSNSNDQTFKRCNDEVAGGTREAFRGLEG